MKSFDLILILSSTLGWWARHTAFFPSCTAAALTSTMHLQHVTLLRPELVCLHTPISSNSAFQYLTLRVVPFHFDDSTRLLYDMLQNTDRKDVKTKKTNIFATFCPVLAFSFCILCNLSI